MRKIFKTFDIALMVEGLLCTAIGFTTAMPHPINIPIYNLKAIAKYVMVFKFLSIYIILLADKDHYHNLPVVELLLTFTVILLILNTSFHIF